jgi:hypothetical protein
MGELIKVDFAKNREELQQKFDKFGERIEKGICYGFDCGCLKCVRRQRKDNLIFLAVMIISFLLVIVTIYSL